jgi:HAD superfamily hydrolase (TIGR01509 family)
MSMDLVGVDPNLAQRTCWVFDMDGTLTVAMHDFEGIKAALGLPPTEPILETLARLPEPQAQVLNAQLKEIELELARKARSQLGAEQLLTELAAKGCQLGIVTRNSKLNAHETLAACGLDRFFAPEYVVSRECCAPKPSPEGILQLLNQWDAPPQQAVMVGDYVFDLVAGRNAGTATVYLDPTEAFPWQMHADYAVADLAQLMRLVF